MRKIVVTEDEGLLLDTLTSTLITNTTTTYENIITYYGLYKTVNGRFFMHKYKIVDDRIERVDEDLCLISVKMALEFALQIIGNDVNVIREKFGSKIIEG